MIKRQSFSANSAVSIDEFRSNLAELVGRVMYGKDKVIIKKYNREAAVLLSLDEYEKLLDPTKRLTKSQWNNAVQRLDKIREKIPSVDSKILEKEIDRTVKEVRSDAKNSDA